MVSVLRQTQSGRRGGANASRLRDHNERRILSDLRLNGPQAGATLAKTLGISAQTASVILRDLDEQGMVTRLPPVRGKVGKPQSPYALAADGVQAYGLRIGRRQADMMLVDFLGAPLDRRSVQYAYPTPDIINGFAASALSDLRPVRSDRCAGIGVAVPFELWNWLEGLGAPREKADLWRDYIFEDAFSTFTDLPLYLANDANLAANGEITFGLGSTLRNFSYFYVGSFVGGAVVLDGQVFHGARGNAGAFGSIPTGDVSTPGHQLISRASLFRLEQVLMRKTGTAANLRGSPDTWRAHPAEVSDWLDGAARALASAMVSVAAVLDVSDVVLDGVFPANVRREAVRRVSDVLQSIDTQGIFEINLHEGRLGAESGVLGAAYQPILASVLGDSKVLRV